MIFSSVSFLYYFLPAVLAVYFLSPKKLKNTVLLVASLAFYGWGEPRYLFLMMGSILMFYLCGLAMDKGQSLKVKKLWLLVSVVVSLLMLGIFKYANFFIENFNQVTGLNVALLRLALPIGISFYTFQCLSYTIDLYRGKAQVQRNLINFAAYVALFPQLIAGPIVRYVDIAEKLEERSHSFDQVIHGLKRFLIGLGKKILLADNFAMLVSIFRDSGDTSVVFYWMYAIAFTLNIYFDFSGYSCMAIGLGEIFGFKFPENFNYPYMSKSISEFWRRWHISLGSWFRDYVYIPLGGNRVGRGRWIINIIVVWSLTGLWHGASWNFVLWGLFYGVLMILEKNIGGKIQLPGIFSHLYVLLVVILGFVLFNAADISQAILDLSSMFGLAGLPIYTEETGYYLTSFMVIFIVGIIGATPLPRFLASKCFDGQWTGFSKEPSKRIVAILTELVEIGFYILLLLISTGYLVDGSFSPFLYFRF